MHEQRQSIDTTERNHLDNFADPEKSELQWQLLTNLFDLPQDGILSGDEVAKHDPEFWQQRLASKLGRKFWQRTPIKQFEELLPIPSTADLGYVSAIQPIFEPNSNTTAHSPDQTYKLRYLMFPEMLGAGGESQINLGYDLKLNRLVAIRTSHSPFEKKIGPELRIPKQRRDSVALDRTPTAPTVYDSFDTPQRIFSGQLPGVRRVTIMENLKKENLMDGKNLPGWLAKQGETWQDKALTVLGNFGQSLDKAPDLHGDVHPDNILFDPETGSVRVIDATPIVPLSEDPNVYGIMHYLNPERLNPDVEEDRRSQSYSFALVALYILTQELPLLENEKKEESTKSERHRLIVTRMLNLENTPDTAFPKEFANRLRATFPEHHEQVIKVFSKALGKHDQRYESCATLIDALRDALLNPESNL